MRSRSQPLFAPELVGIWRWLYRIRSSPSSGSTQNGKKKSKKSLVWFVVVVVVVVLSRSRQKHSETLRLNLKILKYIKRYIFNHSTVCHCHFTGHVVIQSVKFSNLTTQVMHRHFTGHDVIWNVRFINLTKQPLSLYR